MTRRAAVALVAGLALVGAAACGDDGGSGPDGEASGELTYWALWQQDEPQAKVLKKAIDSFEKDTGITVNVEWQGRDNLTKLLAALRTPDVPDLVDQQFFALKGALVGNEQFVDLSDVDEMTIDGEDITVGEAITDKYDAFTKTDDGARFIQPYEVIAYTLWYDGSQLPEVAEQPPASWEDFTAMLGELKAKGDNPLALDADIAGYAEYWTATALIRTLGPGGFRDLVMDEQGSGWDTPEVREALENIAGLAEEEYFIPGYQSSKWPAIQNKWAQGEADFLLMGSWAPAETGPSAAEGFDYRAVNFPTMGESGDTSVPTSVIGFAIPAPANNPDAAKEFIAYFLNKDRLALISSEANNLTPRTDIEPPATLADVKEIVDSHDATAINDGVQADQPDYSAEVFQPLNSQLIAGKLSVDEFVTKIQTDQSKYWELQD